MDAENTYQVFDWLWTSGQPSPRDIAALPDMGIQHVINLALPTASNALPEEAELVTGAGLNYFQIPVPWDTPTRRHLDHCLDLLEMVHGQPTWLHCAKNLRVSAFVYLYRRLRLGEAEDAAAFPLNKIWLPQVWEKYPQWRVFVEEVLK